MSSGWEYRAPTRSNADGQVVETKPGRNAMVTELGVKFRFALPEGKIRWLVLGYRFGGLRLGMRFNGFERVENMRITVAIGAGVF